MMGNGLLVRALVHTGVHKYLEFKAVDGSYVMKQGKTYKVPANDMDALKSSLMGMFEKRRARGTFFFFQERSRLFAHRTRRPTTYPSRLTSNRRPHVPRNHV